METKHTPGKWVSRNETIWNEDLTEAIGIVYNYDYYEGREHIKRIVTAVNSHNELVEALEAMVNSFVGDIQDSMKAYALAVAALKNIGK